MTDDQHPDAAGSAAEREVRELLRRAVAELQPDPGALPRIRLAVPRRRARHRNMLTGVAAAALLAVAAVPALHGVDQVGLSDSPTGGRALAATTGAGTPAPGDDRATARPPAPRPAGSGAGAATGGPATAAASGTAADSPPGPAVSPSGAPVLPPCARADLGRADSYLGSADSGGRIYGWFTVYNISGRSCALSGPGTLQVGAVSGTDPSRVKVADHQAGDPATGLPDPATAPRSLVLQPSTGYRVQFGWVPDAPCPASSALRAVPTGTAAPGGGSAARPSPAPLPSAGSGSGPGLRAADAGGPGTASADPGSAGVPGTPTPTPTASASASPSAGPTAGSSPAATVGITLVETPQAGAPAAASAVVNGACAGTVYRAAPQVVPAAVPAGTQLAGG
ncbi:hypothetical protein GCM10009760_19130 [Kitasatospora kazusensis]|uniref:DUF4232 domain-containing protein n=1 Tax=Kitasatospora kazusensis TaxID=407974 RepID=A0ABP5KVM0_9ACTN